MVVIDEAYVDFAQGTSWVQQLHSNPNLIVTQTLSKAYGMAGIRLGLCFASKEIISVLNKIKPPYNINELTQQKAYDRVSDQSKVQQEVVRIIKARTEVQSQLVKLSFVKEVYRTDANFILVKVDNANKRYEQLITNGIVVRNRSTQPLCDKYTTANYRNRRRKQKINKSINNFTVAIGSSDKLLRVQISV